VFGLTAIFAAMTALLVLVSLAFAQPVLFVVAIPLAVATYAFWYQSSGTLRERLRRSRQAGTGSDRAGAGFGPGARERFESARGQRARQEWERRRGADGRRPGPQSGGMSPDEAYRRLGLEAGADESEVQRAYREKVKEVHPDRGGDEETFRKVNEAYEMLTG